MRGLASRGEGSLCPARGYMLSLLSLLSAYTSEPIVPGVRIESLVFIRNSTVFRHLPDNMTEPACIRSCRWTCSAVVAQCGFVQERNDRVNNLTMMK